MDRTLKGIVLLVIIYSVCLTAVTSAATLPDYPGAVVEGNAEDNDEVSRRLILGSLKKIKNILEPEKVEYVTGTRKSLTLHIPNERRTGVVREFYRNNLLQNGRILFECNGRECGSSNYWANTVFSTAILYGPEQFQYYALAQLNDTSDYAAVYVAMRGTRKIYVHIETTHPTATGSQESVLSEQGRFVFGDAQSTDITDTIVRLLTEDENLVVHVVVHRGLESGSEVNDVINQTRTTGEQIRQDAVSRGISGNRITVHGIGPLAPDEEKGANRIEVLVPSLLIPGPQ